MERRGQRGGGLSQRQGGAAISKGRGLIGFGVHTRVANDWSTGYVQQTCPALQRPLSIFRER